MEISPKPTKKFISIGFDLTPVSTEVSVSTVVHAHKTKALLEIEIKMKK
jgi:hypothetical protein